MRISDNHQSSVLNLARSVIWVIFNLAQISNSDSSCFFIADFTLFA